MPVKAEVMISSQEDGLFLDHRILPDYISTVSAIE